MVAGYRWLCLSVTSTPGNIIEERQQLQSVELQAHRPNEIIDANIVVAEILMKVTGKLLHIVPNGAYNLVFRNIVHWKKVSKQRKNIVGEKCDGMIAYRLLYVATKAFDQLLFSGAFSNKRVSEGPDYDEVRNFYICGN
ncbi:hypothetical protein RF11_07886 [Thelohanellus kitauei]|uniref:Uncharacterized protein n=1 Tax=Thelohanellus kitauei TaxID=669202 RepID=A0A0C2M878_THEKT|nr:hypothetical protein RF11_07886 [Thelohanellus kitauei]